MRQNPATRASQSGGGGLRPEPGGSGRASHPCAPQCLQKSGQRDADGMAPGSKRVRHRFVTVKAALASNTHLKASRVETEAKMQAETVKGRHANQPQVPV